ncbi:MAG: hypothetical protein ITG01_09700 [Comamonas sp.]|nr:hypothetical protein [Comamonas sp.]
MAVLQLLPHRRLKHGVHGKKLVQIRALIHRAIGIKIQNAAANKTFALQAIKMRSTLPLQTLNFAMLHC